MRVEATAPSNIALIKYMGKATTVTNFPVNASLSYSLDHLLSHVVIEERDADADAWRPLEGMAELRLSPSGQKKFLDHFARLKRTWSLPGNYTISSGNEFPSDCGLASSASSFAALTRASAELARTLDPILSLTPFELSRLSRMGSGSSCRSLFSPWALWRGDGAEAVEIDLRLDHAVIIVASEKKTVSSSEAHKRVNSSLLFNQRPQRAETRLQRLLESFRSRQWALSFEICWSEFWDMHALFETSEPSFGYMTDKSLAYLNYIKNVWRETGDGPLVTMDAGANIHLLLRPDQRLAAEQWLTGWDALKSWS